MSPPRSKAQRRLMAIAEHHPEQIRKPNRGVLSMTKSQLHDFASGKEKGLPNRVRKPATTTPGRKGK